MGFSQSEILLEYLRLDCRMTDLLPRIVSCYVNIDVLIDSFLA